MINSPLQFGISISAREIAEQTGLALIPDAVAGVWEVLCQDHGFGDFEQVKARLERRLERLQRVRARIALVDRQIKVYSPHLSVSASSHVLARVEAVHREYEQALDKLVQNIHEQAAGGVQGAADRVVGLGRLSDLNARIANEMVEYLQLLQSSLDGTNRSAFLTPFYEDQVERDFVSFFHASKYCYARFAVAQVKAYLLLHLVHADPRSPFRLGGELNGFESSLSRQEREMTDWLPQPVKALVQELALAAQGGGAVAVSMRSDLGDHGLRFGDDNRVQLCNRVQQWQLEPVESPLFNPHINQRFRLRHAVSARILQLEGGPHSAVGIGNIKDARGGWVIRWNASSKSFTLQFKEPSDELNDNFYLVSRPGPNNDASEIRLTGRWLNRPFDNIMEQQFHLEPYNQPFATRERLLVDEHLLPGGYLTSDTGAYTLYYRHDGAVELVRARDGKVVWSAGGGHPVPPKRLMLQPDGNFVAYDIQGSPYWASGKYFKDQQALYRRSELRVRKDGRVEIRVPGQEIFWITPQP